MNNKKSENILDIDIHDRVTEAYYGLLGVDFMHQTQQRVNWIGKHVQGQHILDVGCSQGILAILLGREGKKVTGIDISQKSIDQANTYLSKEEKSTQALVQFKKLEFLEADFNEQFDSIVMAEVLEHILHPELFIKKAKKLLSDNGQLIVTVPFGINDYIDHKHTYYFKEVYELLSHNYQVEEVVTFGKWIAFRSINKTPSVSTRIDKKYIEQLESTFYEIEREYIRTLAKTKNQLNETRTKLNEIRTKLNEFNKIKAKHIEELQTLKSENHATLTQKNILEQKCSMFIVQNEHLENKLSDLHKLTNKNKQLVERLNVKINKLQIDNNKYERKSTLVYESTSFKIGNALVLAAKSLVNIFVLPKTILHILVKPAKQAPPTINHKKKTKIQVDNRPEKCIRGRKLLAGISIITPSFQGEKYILSLLESIKSQNFPKKMYELIIVLNGKTDNSKNIIESFQIQNPELHIVLLTQEEANASKARNKAIAMASYRYMVLIDDDDRVSSNYLSAMYKVCSEETIVISQLINIDSHGNEDRNSLASRQIDSCISGIDKDCLAKIPSVLNMNACKLIPTCYMQENMFDTSLKSGEDVVFFSKLLSQYKFNIKICHDAIYYRLLRDNSVSRQKLSYEFNITQRLAVIHELDNLLSKCKLNELILFFKSNINSQVSFMNKFILSHRNRYIEVKNDILDASIKYFPFSRLNKGLANDLIISYCFIPYVDTSAIVMAKRIRQQNRVVDVVYNGMDSVRETCDQLNYLSDDLIDKRFQINSPTSFSDFRAIDQFVKETLAKIELNLTVYNRIYSRSLWPASHFTAFECKLCYPDIEWIAEFSDPILYDVHGKERYGKIPHPWHFDRIKRDLNEKQREYAENDNLFFWCEYLPYMYADKLIFTNKNQLEYMIRMFPDTSIEQIIRNKSIITEQPTLPEQYYNLVKSTYPISKNKVNLAYFGALYETRKLNDIIESVTRVDTDTKNAILIHIFTNNKVMFQKAIERNDLSNCFSVNNYVGYFEFLNIATQVDCLIVDDAITKPEKFINPYLPSKLSDYIGSKTPIWALYEKGSILSRNKNITYRSELLNIKQSCIVLKNIVENLTS